MQRILSTLNDLKFKSWVVGFSGGKDSVALLHFLVTHLPLKQLTVVHVNHRLQKDSDQWLEFCRRFCVHYGVLFYGRTVALRGRTENEARLARYRVLGEYVNQESCLLTAHHLNDQIETVFLQLMRGCGLSGLSGMQMLSSSFGYPVARPMLHITSDVVKRYTHQHNLSCVEDVSNHDVSLARNYLRYRILPAFAERWPGYEHSISQTIEHVKNGHDALYAQGELDFLDALVSNDVGFLRLDIDKMLELGEHRLYYVIRVALIKKRWAPIKRACFKELVGRLFLGQKGMLNWGNLTSFVLKKQWWVGIKWKPPNLNNTQFTWLNRSHLSLIGCFKLHSAPTGLDPRIWEYPEAVKICLKKEVACVGMSGKKFKNLMQENQVPVFLRTYVPLLYWKGQLIAVGDFWVNSNYIQNNGLTIEWCWYYKMNEEK